MPKPKDRREPFGAPVTNLPWGLCGNRADHAPHLVTNSAVAPAFFCTARQEDRLPYAAEHRVKEAQHPDGWYERDNLL